MVTLSQFYVGDYFLCLMVLLVLALPYLCRRLNVVVYCGKYLAYCVISTIFAVGCIPVFMFSARNVKNCLNISSFTKHITKVVGIQWDLRDMEHIAEDRGAIIVANHQSIFDVLGMYNYWHLMKKCSAIAKKELFYFWPFGLAAWLGGVVFIDRSSKTKSYNVLFKTAQLMHLDKTKIFIFPEGTRNNQASRTLKLLPFKRGAFKIAISCKVPILPLVYSPYYFLDFRTLQFGSGKVIVKGLPPISTENLTENDVDDLMEKTRDLMHKVFDELSAEIASTLPEDHFLRQAHLQKTKAQ